MSQLPRILKFVCVVSILGLLYYQVVYGKGSVAMGQIWNRQELSWHWSYLILCILLMPINWIFESKKWQILMSPHASITLLQAAKTILAGITLGIVTPARIGEYGGRLLTSRPDQKTEVISATLLGSLAQNLCNIAVGLGFSYYFLKSMIDVTTIDHFSFKYIVGLQIVVLVLVYYNLPKVAHFVEKIIGQKYIGRYSEKLKSLDLYNNSLLHQALLWSLLRYIVYVTQYILVLMFLSIDISLWSMLGGIATIYLIQTGIPLPAFLSIVARGELAILVWSSAGIDEMTALLATFTLWFINLIAPAIIGLVVLLRADIKQYFK